MKIISIIFIFSLFSVYYSNKTFEEESEDVILSTSFEDGDISMFSKRGEWDSAILSLEKDGGKTGSNYLWISGRQANWNGVQIGLDDKCNQGIEYTVSVSLKSKQNSNICLSMQYSYLDEIHYANLFCTVNQGEWVDMKEYKFTMPLGCKNVFLYFEITNGQDDFGIDDFLLRVAPSYTIQEDIPSLKDIYKNYFKFGTATNAGEAPTQQLIFKHFNSITIGNELKPDYLLDYKATLENAEKTGDYTNVKVKIGLAGPILEFCAENNIPLRGHTFVWHSQTPTWFFKEKYDKDGEWVSKETMIKRMENYIKNVFEMIKSQFPNNEFYAWDVVNEAWKNDGTPRNGGSTQENPENSPWVKIFGDNSFIKYAFQFAKKYGIEGCKYFYNDYNEYIEGKKNAIVNMVKEINAGEQLIDGIGMQSHLDVNYPPVDLYESAIKAFSELGVEVQVTELDVTTSDNSDLSFEKQAKYYSDIMDVILKYSEHVTAVVVWGTTDDKSWRAKQYPLLFNYDYTAKPCFYSIVDGLE
ncbi:MAG: endo-1,4-beta-xylanase [Clostridia bacterium]|nr:endo-1,4-beta-xylanase [Clostridia bacterium]